MSYIVSVTVKPQSREQRITWDQERQVFICQLKSAPEKGKANSELIKLFSQKLGIPQASIDIMTGHTEKKKRLKITGEWSLEKIFATLNIQIQQTFLTA